MTDDEGKINGGADSRQGPFNGRLIPLSLASTGEELVFAGAYGGRGLQHRLAEMGLLPGARFRVLAKGRPGPFIVSIRGSRLMLGRGMVHRIYVSPVGAGGSGA